jgi:hypothetical protein
LPRNGAALDPAKLAVQGGQFSADADLAPLLAAVAPLVDLHGLTAQGTVQIRGQADGTAGAVSGQAKGTVKGLSVQGPEGLDLSVPGLTVDASASADERAIQLENLVARWEPLRAMTHAIPNGELAASATWTPADRVLDVPHWTLACPLAGGEGKLKATLRPRVGAGLVRRVRRRWPPRPRSPRASRPRCSSAARSSRCASGWPRCGPSCRPRAGRASGTSSSPPRSPATASPRSRSSRCAASG